MSSIFTTTLILVRHGQDQDNKHKIINGHRNTGLTALGKKQAQQAGEKLRRIKIDAFYSSPLKRARETAQIIENIIKKPHFEIYPPLAERDFGVLTGKEEKEIPRYAQHLLKSTGVTHFWGVKGEESFPHLLKRGKKVLAFMERNHPQQRVLLITHFEISKMIVALWQGKNNWRHALKGPYFQNGEIIKLSP